MPLQHDASPTRCSHRHRGAPVAAPTQARVGVVTRIAGDNPMLDREDVRSRGVSPISSPSRDVHASYCRACQRVMYKFCRILDRLLNRESCEMPMYPFLCRAPIQLGGNKSRSARNKGVLSESSGAGDVTIPRLSENSRSKPSALMTAVENSLPFSESLNVKSLDAP